MNNGTLANVGDYAQSGPDRHRVNLNGSISGMGKRMNLDSIFAAITGLLIIVLLMSWVAIISIIDAEDQRRRENKSPGGQPGQRSEDKP